MRYNRPLHYLGFYLGHAKIIATVREGIRKGKYQLKIIVICDWLHKLNNNRLKKMISIVHCPLLLMSDQPITNPATMSWQ
jgi:hypothetical protein